MTRFHQLLTVGAVFMSFCLAPAFAQTQNGPSAAPPGATQPQRGYGPGGGYGPGPGYGRGGGYGPGMMNGNGPRSGYGQDRRGGNYGGGNAPVSGYGPGYGQGMRGGGYGPGMMRGRGPHWAGKGGVAGNVTARLDALKARLKITAAEEAAWKAYGDKVTAANKTLWDAMAGMHQPGMMWNATAEQRLAFMAQMIRLRQGELKEMRAAAEALVPHLTEFQKGQASEILPGLARGGFGACGMGY